MSTALCFYHSDRQAVEKCERCGRLLCLEDKIKKNYTRNEGTSEHSNYVHYSVILCPLCDINQELKTRKNMLNPLGLIFASFFVIIPFIVGMIFIGISLNVINSELNPPQSPFSWIHQSGPNYFLILFMIPFLLAGIGFGIIVPLFIIKKALSEIKQNPTKIEELQQRKRTFIHSMTSKEALNLFENSLEDNIITCFQCGAKIWPQEKFCSNCGDSTSDEFNQVAF